MPLFVWVLFFEHIALFILLPIFPVIGVVLGLMLASRSKIPPLKVWVSLLIFTIFIGITIVYSDARGLIMRLRRERMAIELSEQYPGSKVIERKYSGGNGMEEPPNMEVVIEGDGPYEEIVQFYSEWFNKNQWKQRSINSWRSNNYEVFIFKGEKIVDGKTVYEINVDFLGYWMTHFRSI